jgi:CBS domain-containing protein
MTTKNSASPEEPAAAKPEPKPTGQFVERMFSGFGHVTEVRPAQAQPQPPSEEPYRPLRQVKARPGETYRLQSHTSELRVQASSPATDVMTDLSRVAAVTTTTGASLDEAHQTMITHGVRALFVVDEGRVVLGIITANDILGERPIQIAQDRGVRHAEILVGEVMTPADLVEAMELQDVLQVRVGDVVETLKRYGRQHALVIESGSPNAASATRTVRGIFSLTQIARQLGLPPQVGRDVARTFAEIEAAIGA